MLAPRALIALVSSAVFLSLFAGLVVLEKADPVHEAAIDPPEPVLGVVSAAELPERPPAREEQDHATVFATPAKPVATQGRRAGLNSGPPKHIRRQNTEIRRQLDHLKALEAERRKVARALAAAGIPDGSGLIGSGRLAWPLSGPLTSPFGQRWGRLHAGIDVSAPAGTPIRAAESGRVALAGWQGGYGLYTCVRHTASLSTCYAHQSRLGTTAGAFVRQGQVIGFVGNTGHSFGNHLHFETWVDGQPVDPMKFL